MATIIIIYITMRYVRQWRLVQGLVMSLSVLFWNINVTYLTIINSSQLGINYIFKKISFLSNTFLNEITKNSDTYFFYVIRYTDFYYFIDNLSILFVLLTLFLLPVSLVYLQFTSGKHIYIYIYLLSILTLFLLIFFLTSNILLFYICFEFVLLPLFMIVVYFGSRSRKYLAAYYFFLYTFIGSILLLFAVIILYLELGTLNLFLFSNYTMPLFISNLV